MLKKPKHNAKSIHQKNNHNLPALLIATALVLLLALLTPSLTGLLEVGVPSLTQTGSVSSNFCLTPVAPSVLSTDSNPDFGLSFKDDSNIETVYALDKSSRKLNYFSIPGTLWHSKTVSAVAISRSLPLSSSSLYTMEVPLKPPTFAAVSTGNSIVYASKDASFKFVKKTDGSVLTGNFTVSTLYQLTESAPARAIVFGQKDKVIYLLSFATPSGSPLLSIDRRWTLTGAPILNAYAMSASTDHLLLLTNDSNIIHYLLSTGSTPIGSVLRSEGDMYGTLRARRNHLPMGSLMTAVLAPKSGANFYFGASDGKLYRQIYTNLGSLLAPVQVASFSGRIKSIQQTDDNTLYVLTNTAVHKYLISENRATQVYALDLRALVPSELDHFIQLIISPNKELFVSAKLAGSNGVQLFKVTNECNAVGPSLKTKLSSGSNSNSIILTVVKNSAVKLTATATDSDGIASIEWKQQSGFPSGVKRIDGAYKTTNSIENVLNLNFTQVGSYNFSVNATDKGNPKKSTVSTVKVIVSSSTASPSNPVTVVIDTPPHIIRTSQNKPPVVSESLVNLSVSAVAQNLNDELTFTWSQTTGPSPYGDPYILNLKSILGTYTSAYRVNLTQLGEYKFKVTVSSHSSNLLATKEFTVNVVPKTAATLDAAVASQASPALSVDVVGNQWVTSGSSVLLNATALTNTPNGQLSFSWHQVDGPPLSDSSIIDGSLTDAFITLSLTEIGNYTFDVTAMLDPNWDAPLLAKKTLGVGEEIAVPNTPFKIRVDQVNAPAGSSSLPSCNIVVSDAVHPQVLKVMDQDSAAVQVFGSIYVKVSAIAYSAVAGAVNTCEVSAAFPSLIALNRTTVFVVDEIPNNVEALATAAPASCAFNASCTSFEYCVSPGEANSACTPLFCSSSELPRDHKCVPESVQSSASNGTSGVAVNSGASTTGSTDVSSGSTGGNLGGNTGGSTTTSSGSGASTRSPSGDSGGAASRGSSSIGSNIETAAGEANALAPNASAVDRLKGVITTPQGGLNLPVVAGAVIVLLLLVAGIYFMLSKKKPPVASEEQPVEENPEEKSS